MVAVSYLVFFFNDTATTEIYTLSLHDALPILVEDDGVEELGALDGEEQEGQLVVGKRRERVLGEPYGVGEADDGRLVGGRSEEHTSELQSRQYLVCRLLLEKKKQTLRG